METIQVSVAHAYPGTELHEYAMKNGFISADTKMVDEGGHQMVQIQFPDLPADELMESVHRFYDEYYFRPKAIYRILRKSIFDSSERKGKDQVIENHPVPVYAYLYLRRLCAK